MSLLAPLRASSSRLLVSLPTASHSFHTAAAASAASGGQAAAKSSNNGKAGPGWTVQDVDEQLSKMQKQQEQMKRSGQHFDFYSINVPVLERIAEPPASITWAFKPGGWKWVKERVTRYRQDRQFLNEMIKRNAFPKRKGNSIATSIYHSIMCLRPTYKAGVLVEELKGVWERYNKAQASRDESTLQQTATAHALSSARALSRSPLKMDWSLISYTSEPVVLAARLAPIDLEGAIEVAQITLRIDATQALTVGGGRGQKEQRKEQRTVENWVFERHLPARMTWRVKERVETTQPSVKL